MKTKFIAVVISVFLVSSCGKKITYSGIVYSKNHIPLPNVPVTFAFGHGGKEQTDTYYKIQTDANGAFVYNLRLRRNQFLGHISVKCDSGNYYNRYDCYNCGGGFGSKTDMEIILQ